MTVKIKMIQSSVPLFISDKVEEVYTSNAFYIIHYINGTVSKIPLCNIYEILEAL